ncbi:MAG: hypothetical protein ABS58_04695 [Mesorhizobium sp. SCN 65-20]|nr:MAG: hypothetical protein ABS58_04695 [Mesorhizobium sp. SCN 65-20]
MTQVDRKRATEVMDYWRAAGLEKWFRKDEMFDDHFRESFGDLHMAAAKRHCDAWAEDAEGSLALMILLDQFPRNCFRGSGHMYATDPLARYFARKAIADGFDMATEGPIRVFFYLPFSHSETLADHDIPLERSTALGGEFLKHAVGHRDIVARFGRFPHRNLLLGRDSTPQELAFLESGGFAG